MASCKEFIFFLTNLCVAAEPGWLYREKRGEYMQYKGR